MSRERAAAVVTWAYALGFGVPTVPVSIHLVRHGHLPSFLGLFEMFGGPWSASLSDRAFVGLLMLFGAATVLAAFSGVLLWRQRRIGAMVNLATLPLEAACWVGFALPLPWLAGLARVVLISRAWGSLSGTRRAAS